MNSTGIWIIGGFLAIALVAILVFRTRMAREISTRDEGGGTAVAFLALNSPRACTEAELVAALSNRTSAKIELDESDDEQSDEARTDESQFDDAQTDVKMLTIGGHMATVAMMPAPIPWDDLEGPCATSWLWPDATEIMKAHKAHLIVAVMGDKGTRLEKTQLLTDLMVACIDTHDAAGVYWGAGTVVHSPEFFIEWATDEDSAVLPVELWVEFRFQRNEDNSLNVITTGMEQFGCMEIEVLNTKADFDTLMSMLTGVAQIMIHGEVIADGDTIGPDAETKIKTTHEPSVWDRPGPVLRLNL